MGIEKNKKSTDQGKKKQIKKIFLALVCIVLIVVVVIVALVFKRRSETSELDESQQNAEDVSGGEDEKLTAEGETRQSTDLFDEERLKLVSGMEYEGPDFEDGSMESGNYTALQIQNVSDSFLRSANIEVKVNDSDNMSITIDSLPAGETVIVIGQGYEQYSEQDVYEVVSCESSYEESVVCEKEGLSVAYETGMIRLTNQTAEDMAGMTCRYKGKAGDMLLGGITYEFTVDSLPAGQTYETESQNFLADSVQIIEIKE